MLPANMRRSIFTPIYGLHFRKSRLSIQKQKQESFERNFIGKYHATLKYLEFSTQFASKGKIPHLAKFYDMSK